MTEFEWWDFRDEAEPSEAGYWNTPRKKRARNYERLDLEQEILFPPNGVGGVDTKVEPHVCPAFPIYIPIRKKVLEKLDRYGEMVTEELGEELEFHALFLVNDNIIEDAVLAKDQEVGFGHTELTSDSIMATRKAFVNGSENSLRIGGSYHRHGILGFSGTDNKDLPVIMRATDEYLKLDTDQSAKFVYDMVKTPYGLCARMLISFACGAEVVKIRPVQLLGGGEDYDEDEMRAEVVNEVHKPTYSYSNPKPYQYEETAVNYPAESTKLDPWERAILKRGLAGDDLYAAIKSIGLPKELKDVKTWIPKKKDTTTEP